MKKINSLPLKGFALPFVFLFAFSCNSSSPNISAMDQALEKAPKADTSYAVPSIPGIPTPQGLLLVKEACLHVSVTNMRSTGQHLERWLENTGGYYADWTQAQDGDSLRLELTARVPVENFEAFKDSAETLGVLTFETASADDALAVLDKSGAEKEGAEAAGKDVGKLRRHSAMSTVRVKIVLLLATIWPLALLIGGGVLLVRVLSRFKAAPKP